MMCGKVSEHLLFIEKRGKMEKELEKRGETGEWKSRKADKNKEISYMWKMEKNQENERIILTKWHFYAYNKIRCLKK